MHPPASPSLSGTIRAAAPAGNWSHWAESLSGRGAFSEEEQLIIERVRNHEAIAELEVDGRRIRYAPKIAQGRVLSALTPEELRRALLVVELIDSHGYRPEHIALEQERRVGDSKHRIDLLL